MSAAAATRAIALALVLVPLAAAPARAQAVSELYRATAIVTGTDLRSRPAGFAQCLREVLVKVSGEPRLHDDPRIVELAAHAEALVVAFDYADQMAGIPIHDDQGTYDRPHDLTVGFDRARIDDALRRLGEQPWRGERPVVVPVVAVRGFAPPYRRTYLLSAENPDAADQRASLANSARTYGIALRVPSDAELAAWVITADRFPSPPPPSAPNQAVVGGTIEFREDTQGSAWIGSWRMRWQGVDYAWQIAGVNFDEAFNDLVRGVVRVASGHGAPD